MHDEAPVDRFVADGLRQMRLADTRRADEEHIGALADLVTGGRFVWQRPWSTSVGTAT